MRKLLARLLCHNIQIRVKDITPSWIEPALIAGYNVPEFLRWRLKQPDPSVYQRFQLWLVKE